MNWNEILMESLPSIITILSVIVAAILGYFKVVNWDPKVVERVLAKIAEAIFETEIRANDRYSSGNSPATSEDKLKTATMLAIDKMDPTEIKVMEQLGKAKDKKSDPFMNAVQSVFKNTAQNLLEYGVKKGIDKVIGK